VQAPVTRIFAQLLEHGNVLWNHGHGCLREWVCMMRNARSPFCARATAADPTGRASARTSVRNMNEVTGGWRYPEIVKHEKSTDLRSLST